MRFRVLLALVAIFVFAMTGVAAAREATGTLVFEHDIEGGPAMEVVVLPFEQESEAVSLGEAVLGEIIEAELPVGTHTTLLVAGEAVGSGTFTIEADEQTLIDASELITPPSPPSPSPPASPTPSPEPVG